MKVTWCGEYRKRKYIIKAELTGNGKKIKSFNAIFYPQTGGISSLLILPEKPVSTSTNPLNQAGKKLKLQLCEFLENSFQAERSTIH